MAMLGRSAVVMASVVLLHALALALAWRARIVLSAGEEAVQIALLSPPPREQAPSWRAPVQVRLVAPALEPSLAEPFELSLPPADVEPREPSAPTASQAPAPAAAEVLGPQLAVQCPQRTPPRYPAQAKRQREQGEVRLRVELDESGRVVSVTVIGSSGSPRLDEAARTAIQSWRCQPAQQDGHPVRAVALQSLDFVLEHH